jgi:hypothetical protein
MKSHRAKGIIQNSRELAPRAAKYPAITSVGS